MDRKAILEGVAANFNEPVIVSVKREDLFGQLHGTLYHQDGKDKRSYLYATTAETMPFRVRPFVDIPVGQPFGDMESVDKKKLEDYTGLVLKENGYDPEDALLKGALATHLTGVGVYRSFESLKHILTEIGLRDLAQNLRMKQPELVDGKWEGLLLLPKTMDFGKYELVMPSEEQE